MRKKALVVYILSISGLVILLSSCILAYSYQADVLFPAQIKVPPHIQNIGVICRMDLDSRSSEGFRPKGHMQDYKRDSALLKQSVFGLEDVLIESPRFNVVKTNSKRSLTGFRPDPSVNLPWYLLEKICPDTTDLIIEMVTASFNDTVITIMEPDGYSQNYYSTLSSIYWRLYDFEKKDVMVYRIQDTVLVEPRDPGDNSKYSHPPTVLQILKRSSYQGGTRFGSGIAPSWKEIDRIYFKSFLPDFAKAESCIVEGNWLGAAEKWRSSSRSKNRYIASRASFNMALAAEMNDHFDISKDWLEMAKDLGLREYVDEYLEEIEERISQKAKLDNQLSSFE